MNYSKKINLIWIDLTDLSPDFLSDFQEFLRQNMIIPVITGGVGTATNGSPASVVAYYSGCFSIEAVGKIEAWLEQNKAKEVEQEKEVRQG